MDVGHLQVAVALLQVRSAACRACGRTVRALPDACRPFLADLWPLWISHLDDNIPSVREDAAIALGDAAAALQQEALSILIPHLRWDACDQAGVSII